MDYTTLIRALKGQALVDEVAKRLHANLSDPRSLPADDPHWKRRALAMLRQRGCDPFRREGRGGVAAVRGESVISHVAGANS